MPGYIKQALATYLHSMPAQPQHSPYLVLPQKYGAAAQDPLPINDLPEVDEKDRLRIQQVVGTIMYYAHAVDLTLPPALSSLASEQATTTEKTMKKLKHMMDYLATHPGAKIRFIRRT